MNAPVRERDLELLSAYLDNQLPEGEKSQLERRLKAEPELREALAGLRATVRAMRRLPAVKIPRNFTLDPQIYGRTQPARTFGWAYGFLRLGTALATVLFVVTVAGDFLARSSARSLAVPAAAPVAQQAVAPTETPEAALAPFAAEAATTEEAEAPLPAETEVPPRGPTQPTGLLLEGGPRPAGGGGGPGGGGEGIGGGGGPEEAASPPAEALTAPTATPELAAAAAMPVEGTAEASPSAADQATLNETARATAPLESSAKVALSETPPAIAQGEARGQAPTPAPQPITAASPPIDWLRAAQVAFGVLAVGLGLATLWYRSRNL